VALLSSFKNLPIMIEQIKQYLAMRIAELNKADVDFCKDRWDMTKPKMERDLHRGFSNEVTFARQELERTLKFLNELSKGAVSGLLQIPPLSDEMEDKMFKETTGNDR
jgi:hypothetical protein